MSNIWPPQISFRAQRGKLADLWSAGFTYTSLHVCTRWLYETELTFFAMLQPLRTYELLLETLSCFFLLKNDALLHSVVHWENRGCKKTADEGMARSTRGPNPPSSDRNLRLGAMPSLHLVRSRKGSIYWDRWEDIGRAALNSSSASWSALKTWDTCRHRAAEPWAQLGEFEIRRFQDEISHRAWLSPILTKQVLNLSPPVWFRPSSSSFGQEKVNEARFFLFDFARRELSPLVAAPAAPQSGGHLACDQVCCNRAKHF